MYPVFTQPGGLYDEDAELVLEMTPSAPLPEGYKIYFTSNGQEPTKRHDEYSYSFPLLTKNTSITIRAACFDPEGERVGPIITQTYIRNRDNRFTDSTIVAVTATESDLNGAKGIFANPTMSGKEWERPAHIEIIQNGEKVADQNGGIRVFGTLSSAKVAIRALRADTVVIACQLMPERLKLARKVFADAGVRVTLWSCEEKELETCQDSTVKK